MWVWGLLIFTKRNLGTASGTAALRSDPLQPRARDAGKAVMGTSKGDDLAVKNGCNVSAHWRTVPLLRKQ